MMDAGDLTYGQQQQLPQSVLAPAGVTMASQGHASSLVNQSMPGFQAMHQQPLFSGAATANFELPFMLSMETDAADDPEAAAAFSEMLKDLLAESEPPPEQWQQQQLQQEHAAQVQPVQQPDDEAPVAAIQPPVPSAAQLQQQLPVADMLAAMQMQMQQPLLNLTTQGVNVHQPGFASRSMMNGSVPSGGEASAMQTAYQQVPTVAMQFPPGIGMQIDSGSAGQVPGAGLAPGLPPQTTSGVSIAAQSLPAAAERASHSGAETEVNSSRQGGHQPMLPTGQHTGLPPQVPLGLRRSHMTRSSSGSETSRGKSGAVHVDPATRRAAVQKRYRQKKESMLRVLHAEANKQQEALEALEEEHAALMGKQQALEKLVMCRDEQLLILSKVRGMCHGSRSVQNGMKAEDPTVSWNMHADYKLAGCWGPDCAAPLPVDEAQLLWFKQMTVEDLRRVWTSFVAQASQHLSTAAMSTSHSDGEAGKELEELVYEHGLTFRYSIQLNCPVVYMLMQLNLDTGRPAAPPDTHWQRVNSLIELTPMQRHEAVSMFGLYCALMEKVHEERRMLKARLAELVTTSTTQADLSPLSMPADSMSHLVANAPAYLLPPGPCCADEMSCAEQLYLNLHKERSTRCLLCCFFLGKLLTRTQLAKAAVASHPWFPDPLSLSKQLATEAGQLRASSSSGWRQSP